MSNERRRLQSREKGLERWRRWRAPATGRQQRGYVQDEARRQRQPEPDAW
jgi:hypothetical protein